ncbi:MAG: amidase [Chthoniobacterales bacterium]
MTTTRLPALAILALFTAGCANTPDARRDRLAKQTFIERLDTDDHPSAVRLAVKDLIDVRGTVTTAGSEYLFKTRPPAKRDAPLLARSRAAEDVVIVGKANLTEFAIGPAGVNDYFGTPPSPLLPPDARPRVPGGSSSGSAIAVAENFADIAFGTDTAGSVRIPAAWSGVYGLKTTFGLVPLEGVYPLSPENLDTVGPLARTIPELVRGMDLLEAGFDAKYRRAAAAAPTGAAVRVGRFRVPGTALEIDQAVDRALVAAGFQIVELDDSFADAWKQADEYGGTIAVTDGAHSNWAIRNEKGVSQRSQETIFAGSLTSEDRYREAIRGHKPWRRTLERTLDRVDFIALPTVNSNPLPIPTFLRRNAIIDSLVFAQQNTVAVNYAGNPAIAIPIPLEDELVDKTSLQLIGGRYREAELINAARLVELGLEENGFVAETPRS